jgi:hypothetical protein
MSARCSGFAISEFRAGTSIDILTVWEKTKHGLDGAGIAAGDVLNPEPAIGGRVQPTSLALERIGVAASPMQAGRIAMTPETVMLR